MDRYAKYLKIIDEADKCLEQQGMKLLEGQVSMANLAKIKEVLCIMDLAWKCAWQVDHLDDIYEGMGKIAKHGEGPDKQAVKAMEGQPETGNDFRSRGGYSRSETGFDGSPTPDFRQEESRRRRDSRGRYRSEALEDLMDAIENRRGRRRRYRSEDDSPEIEDVMDFLIEEIENRRRYRTRNEQAFMMVPGLGWPNYMNSRMGYHTDPNKPEQNAPYNNDMQPNTSGNISPNAGIVHAPLQSMSNNVGNNMPSNTSANNTANNKTTNTATGQGV